jgi:DNA-binding transcriptional MerR regulator
LPRLQRILALKGLGVSLDQIASALDEGLTPEQIRAEGFIGQFECHCSANESDPMSMMTAWNRNQFDVRGNPNE